MKIDRFFQLFVVKEKKFFPLYIELSKNILAGANRLVDLTMEQDEIKRLEIARAIKACERDGDKTMATILEELYKTFVTPFDREDVHQLASRMDSFLDFINDSAKKISIYQPTCIDEAMVQMAKLIEKDAELLVEAVSQFEELNKRADAISDLCKRIGDIEHEGDDLYEDYMSHLFTQEKNPIEVIKKKNIIQSLEDTTDHAKSVAEVIRTIIVKQA